MAHSAASESAFERFRTDFARAAAELGKRVVGQAEAVEGVLTALFAGGHVLLEGPPSSGKTFLVRTLAEVAGLPLQRIACAPDLAPADVIGTYVVMETAQGRRTFDFHKGPLFGGLVLADHIHRALPKTQSALLEALEEDSLSVSTETIPLPRPQLIAATQNPDDPDGTFPLPESQLDRFLLSLSMAMPDAAALVAIVERATSREQIPVSQTLDGPRVLEMIETARSVSVDAALVRRAVDLVRATDPANPQSCREVKEHVRHGVGPRGVIALLSAAKVTAAAAGRDCAAWEDIARWVRPVLRHRLALGLTAAADGLTPDALIDRIVAG